MFETLIEDARETLITVVIPVGVLLLQAAAVAAAFVWGKRLLWSDGEDGSIGTDEDREAVKADAFAEDVEQWEYDHADEDWTDEERREAFGEWWDDWEADHERW